MVSRQQQGQQSQGMVKRSQIPVRSHNSRRAQQGRQSSISLQLQLSHSLSRSQPQQSQQSRSQRSLGQQALQLAAQRCAVVLSPASSMPSMVNSSACQLQLIPQLSPKQSSAYLRPANLAQKQSMACIRGSQLAALLAGWHGCSPCLHLQ